MDILELVVIYRFEIINSTNQVFDCKGDVIPVQCKAKLVS